MSLLIKGISLQDVKDNVKLNELQAPDGAVAMNSQKITGLAAAAAQSDAIAADANVRAPNATQLQGKIPSNAANQIPVLDGSADLPLANLDPSVCSETELATAVSNHAGVAAAHHTKTPADTVATIVSDVLRNSNDGAKSSNVTSYTKVKEVKLNAPLGACRLKFDMKCPEAHTVKAKVYKNGVPEGAEQTTASTSYVTKSEDFSGWTTNDLIQIYVRPTVEYDYTYIQNMRFYYTKNIAELGGVGLATPLESDEAISITNQDP